MLGSSAAMASATGGSAAIVSSTGGSAAIVSATGGSAAVSAAGGTGASAASATISAFHAKTKQSHSKMLTGVKCLSLPLLLPVHFPPAQKPNQTQLTCFQGSHGAILVRIASHSGLLSSCSCHRKTA